MVGEAKVVIGTEGEEASPGELGMRAVGPIEGRGGPEPAGRAEMGELLFEVLF